MKPQMNLRPVGLSLALITGPALLMGLSLFLDAPSMPSARPMAAPVDRPSWHSGGHDRLRPRPVTGPVTGAVAGRAFVTPEDTIDGSPIADPALVARIEHIAAALPPHVLAQHPRSPAVRYLAQAFGPGDDAAVHSGVFRDPAAALAFGCALDDEPANPCGITPATAASRPYEEIPGVRCVPMQWAVGAPVFEPDRCEPSG